VIFSFLPALCDAAESNLSGLWEARRIFGPEVSGPLLVRRSGADLLAEIGGHQVEVSFDEGGVAFALPNGARFEGALEEGGDIRGHWLQPRSRLDGNVFATPVLLRPRADGWSGEVTPQPDTGTFYLLLSTVDGEMTAEFINPERNLGIFQNLTRMVRDGDSLSLYGKFRGRGEERVMLGGYYYPDEEVIALRYRGRGGNYDFRRINAEHAEGFLARSSSTASKISVPPVLDDGWSTASPADVGIDAARILDMIETEILPAPTGPNDLSVHALLIARHGKLVVEEYFHGYHRDLPHDSRSASKSVTAILAAAVMQSGADLSWDTPVYVTLNMNELLQREPERGDITLRHLVNMNSGLDCDDNNPESAAQEDVLWDNADELDFYLHTLNVGVVHAPGKVAAYCSASANLAGGVIAASTDHSLLQLIDRLVADPLDIRRYSVPVPPDGHPFMGGGTRWLPRDFLKFPQLLLDDGEWNKRRVLSSTNVRRLLTPAIKMGERDYGYLWWVEDYPYKGRSIRAHFMGGNGGQIAMLVPELQLSIVFNAGNYSDRVMFRIQEELIPNYILPAITD
jgi:CubicO group peptidase (beta-lactamase class C family)